LGDERIADATGCFDQALAANPASARALLGAGLARLSGGDSAGAAPLFDKAADLFGDHLGSWVAAGWAYFTVGDLARARQRFETALALDDTFAEAHGGLAVVDVLEKRFDEARRGAQTALRLDRECFSGILARTLLLDEAGEAAAATRLRDAALDAPIGPGGQTIAQALVGFTSRRKPR
jgi:tetratricopeptide (TPR) repeat protein